MHKEDFIIGTAMAAVVIALIGIPAYINYKRSGDRLEWYANPKHYRLMQSSINSNRYSVEQQQWDCFQKNWVSILEGSKTMCIAFIQEDIASYSNRVLKANEKWVEVK